MFNDIPAQTLYQLLKYAHERNILKNEKKKFLLFFVCVLFVLIFVFVCLYMKKIIMNGLESTTSSNRLPRYFHRPRASITWHVGSQWPLCKHRDGVSLNTRSYPLTLIDCVQREKN